MLLTKSVSLSVLNFKTKRSFDSLRFVYGESSFLIAKVSPIQLHVKALLQIVPIYVLVPSSLSPNQVPAIEAGLSDEAKSHACVR